MTLEEALKQTMLEREDIHKLDKRVVLNVIEQMGKEEYPTEHDKKSLVAYKVIYDNI